jgi:hypothetical protein
MEEKKRKVVTYHSTISNEKLERELNKNEGYRVEDTFLHGNYLVMVLVKDSYESFMGEAGRNRNLTDYVTLDVSDDAEKKRLFNEGYKVYRLTTKNCVMVKYES